MLKTPENDEYWTVSQEVPDLEAMSTSQYKYNEDKILAMLSEYIDKTYSEHYVTKSVQTVDVWDALNIGPEACQSNVLKYAMRLGKKDGHNPKDMMKILHYTMLWYHFVFLKPEQDNEAAEIIAAFNSIVEHA